MKRIISFFIFVLLITSFINAHTQPEPVPPPSQAQMAEYQRKLLNDPKIINSIETISQDQDLVDKFLDPELMNLIMSGDLEKIQTHPHFQKLINDPRLQNLIRQAQENIAP
jgi:hypothetical protein